MFKPTRRELLGSGVAFWASINVPVDAQGVPNSAGDDWPQWRGPSRDGVSGATGLMKSWPEGGPRLLWKAEGLGYGYGSPATSDKRVYGVGYQDGQEIAWSLDLQTGRSRRKGPFANPGNPDPDNRGAGPRSTPTIDGERVYVLGVAGDLACFDHRGKGVWRKNLVRDLGGAMPGWGYSESPLVDGDRVVVTPGGQTATMAALNKGTGETVWRSAAPGGDRAEYASMIVATVENVRQYIQFTKGGVIGVAAADGQFLWRFPHAAGNVANCPTPVFRDGFVFATAGYGRGAALGRISKSGGNWSAETVYQSTRMTNHHGGVVLVGEHLYGMHDAAGLTCLDFKTGEVKWSDRTVGKGSLIAADGHLYCRKETNGEMTLVEVNPTAAVVKGRFVPPRDPNQPPARPTGMAWAHPVISGTRLLLRDQNTLFCYELKAG